DSTAPVHLCAPLSGLVRDRGHAAPAVAAALFRGRAVLPRRRGREVDPPSCSAAVTTGPLDGANWGVTGSVVLRHEVPPLERGLIVIRTLHRARGELHLLTWDLLVGDELEQVTDAVETRAPLVIRPHDVPAREVGVGGLQHHVARPRVLEPPAPRAQVGR